MLQFSQLLGEFMWQLFRTRYFKMKANDVLTNSETATDEAIALGIDISKTGNYEEGQLTRFVSVEYKSDLRT
jgi:hypothetical protein